MSRAKCFKQKKAPEQGEFRGEHLNNKGRKIVKALLHLVQLGGEQE
jgi:hypothetical protein